MEVSADLGPVTVLSVKGDIDSDTFRQLVEQANQVIAKGYANLVLDLHEVNYISSGGLVALQTIVGQAAAHAGRAAICGVSKGVARVLDLTGFTQRLSIFPDVTTAKASFAQA